MFLFSSPHFNTKERIHFVLLSAVNLQTRTFRVFKFRFGVSEKNHVSTFTFQTSGAVMKTRLKKKSLAMECYNNWTADLFSVDTKVPLAAILAKWAKFSSILYSKFQEVHIEENAALLLKVFIFLHFSLNVGFFAVAHVPYTLFLQLPCT